MRARHTHLITCTVADTHVADDLATAAAAAGFVAINRGRHRSGTVTVALAYRRSAISLADVVVAAADARRRGLTEAADALHSIGKHLQPAAAATRRPGPVRTHPDRIAAVAAPRTPTRT